MFTVDVSQTFRITVDKVSDTWHPCFKNDTTKKIKFPKKRKIFSNLTKID